MKMDKDIFWRIIDAVNSEVKPSDQEGILRATQEKLLNYSPREIAAWGSIQRYYKELADTSGVFAVSCCLNDYMSDDGFMDFRMWLISRGKEVYTAALQNPDSLADLDILEDTRFESYGYVANDAYKKAARGAVRGDLYDAMKRYPLTEAQKADLHAEIGYFHHRVTNENAETHLPALFKKYLEPGASPSFGYRPSNLCPSPADRMSELEKLENAALLIENSTDNRFKYSSSGSFLYRQFPAEPPCVFIDLQKQAESSSGPFTVRFTAHISTNGDLDATGLRLLRQEVDEACALLASPELQPMTLTTEEMQEFDDFIRGLEEQREAQEQSSDPVMGQQL